MKASSPKTSGTATEATSIAPIAANIAIRTAPSSGLIVFVSQA